MVGAGNKGEKLPRDSKHATITSLQHPLRLFHEIIDVDDVLQATMNKNKDENKSNAIIN